MEAATRQLIVIVIFPDSYQLVEREPGNPSLSAISFLTPYLETAERN